MKKSVHLVYAVREKIVCRARGGFGLPMTLTIALVGAIMIGVVFTLATRFGTEEGVFRYAYSDQVLASSYIERAKGTISAWISEEGRALHPTDGDTWNTHPAIHSIDDLQIFLDTDTPAGDPLNLDEVRGDRRVTMQVYDLTYSATQSIPDDMADEERLRLPAPLALVTMQTSQASFENAGMVEGEGDVRYPSDSSGEGSIDLNDIGAYLIRVQIFGADGRLERTTEEAFFILAN